MRIIKLIVILTMLSFTLTALAQDVCPVIVNTGVETTQTACGGASRNQLCYGNSFLTVTPYEGVTNVHFEQSGDLVSVADVQTLQLGALNLTDETWGVALMKLQANLPDTQPDQNVTLVFFGDVEIENTATGVSVGASISAPNAINVRSGPSTSDSTVASLNPGTRLSVNGRNETGDWVRIKLPDNSGDGWVAAFLLQFDADPAALDIVAADTQSYSPMQAFSLRSGVKDASCAEAPDSGVLIQTPPGADVAFNINGLGVRPGGTIFVQAEDTDSLLVHALEGSAIVSANERSVIVPAGAAAVISVNEELIAADQPVDSTPYNLDDLQSLPLALLPRQLELIEPLTEREIKAAISRETRCKIMTTAEEVNFREGPATAYFAKGTLVPGRLYVVSGQTVGRDGFVWWQIINRWVRSDVVTTSGNCDEVRVVTARPDDPSAAGFSTNLTCTSERVVYADVGDVIPISVSYASSAVPVGAINSKIYVDGNLVLDGDGTASGSGIVWNTTWVATQGIHNVEVLHTAVVQIKPDWANNPFEPGEGWSYAVCQIRVD